LKGGSFIDRKGSGMSMALKGLKKTDGEGNDTISLKRSTGTNRTTVSKLGEMQRKVKQKK